MIHLVQTSPGSSHTTRLMADDEPLGIRLKGYHSHAFGHQRHSRIIYSQLWFECVSPQAEVIKLASGKHEGQNCERLAWSNYAGCQCHRERSQFIFLLHFGRFTRNEMNWIHAPQTALVVRQVSVETHNPFPPVVFCHLPTYIRNAQQHSKQGRCHAQAHMWRSAPQQKSKDLESCVAQRLISSF